MLFRVKKPFDWDGSSYKPGDVIDIPENHPRLGGMLQGRHILYDASDAPATEQPKTRLVTRREVIEVS